jgi:hypothetical protein
MERELVWRRRSKRTINPLGALIFLVALIDAVMSFLYDGPLIWTLITAAIAFVCVLVYLIRAITLRKVW